MRRARGVPARRAPRRRVSCRGAAGQHARAPVLDRRLRAGGRHAGRAQFHASRCRPRARPHPHAVRLPGHRNVLPRATGRRTRARARRPVAGDGRRILRRDDRPLSRRPTGPRRARSGCTVLPDIHVRDQWRPEGGDLLPRARAAQQRDAGRAAADVEARRDLRTDAAVPLLRPADGAAAAADRRRRRGVASPLLGIGFPGGRAPLRRDHVLLRRQATGVHSRDAGARRRRRQHAARGLRQRGIGRRYRDLRAPLRLYRDRQLRLLGRLHHGAAHATDAARLARSRRQPVHRGDEPRHRAGMPARTLRRRGRAAQRQRGHRRTGQSRGRRAVRGLLEQPGGGGRASARTQLLEWRSRLPRRGGVFLFCRAQQRMAARRRREPLRDPDRAGAGAPPPGQRRRRVRGSRSAGRRPRDGGAATRARRLARHGAIRGLPRRAAGFRQQVEAVLRAHCSPSCRSPRPTRSSSAS